MGIDVQDPVSGHIHLVFSNGTAGCENLTVNVGQTYFVIIDQIKSAHTASGKSLHRISADTAYTEHSNSGIRQSLHIIFSKQ